MNELIGLQTILPVKEQDLVLFTEFLNEFYTMPSDVSVTPQGDQFLIEGSTADAYAIGYAFAEWKCWKKSMARVPANILEHSNEIVFKRGEEKARQYGPFHDSMVKTAKIASLMCDKDISTNDCYNVMVALKLARESYAHKYDNLLDAISYLAQKNNSIELERNAEW